jgi:DNA-binding MarR family transcriptional regulator
MKPSRERPSQDEFKIRYEHTSDSNKKYNAATRSLKNLMEKGYVDLYGNHMRIIVVLTDVGKAFAEKWLANE